MIVIVPDYKYHLRWCFCLTSTCSASHTAVLYLTLPWAHFGAHLAKANFSSVLCWQTHWNRILPAMRNSQKRLAKQEDNRLIWHCHVTMEGHSAHQ